MKYCGICLFRRVVYYYMTFLEPVHLCTEEAVGFEATPLMFVCRSQRRLLPRTRRPQFNALPCSRFPSSAIRCQGDHLISSALPVSHLDLTSSIVVAENK